MSYYDCFGRQIKVVQVAYMDLHRFLDCVWALAVLCYQTTGFLVRIRLVKIESLNTNVQYNLQSCSSSSLGTTNPSRLTLLTSFLMQAGFGRFDIV
jgi:hypothetical protein